LVDDLHALLDALAIERAALVGVSMGAVTVLRCAARFPQRVGRVLAADGQWASPAGAHELWAKRIAVAREQGMGALAGPTAGRWFRPPTVAARGPALVQTERMIETTSVDGYCDCASAMQSYDFSADFPHLAMPIQYVVGAQDGTLPAVMREMYRATPDARLTEIDDAGHLPNLEQPEVFNHVLTAFLHESKAGAHPSAI
jgi:3-oxoadipate enol-lactonase